ncbi:MAG: sodium-dependent transporter [Clostridia bacterium]|nr:sodium-dependent transporter [Clostridia bacterium]
MNEKKRGSFTGGIGFVLAAAGSAVGLGNLWRFPYLAAQNGGGIFLLVYVLLALTFGFALMTTEIAIGRRTKKSPIKAYGEINKKFGFLGVLSAVVPFIIFPYYCVIGGWVTKYTADFMIGQGMQTVADGYFWGFITSQWSPIIWTAIFMGATALIVLAGVDKGIEKFSKVLMPILCVLIVAIAVFTITIKGTDGRTALEGLKIYLVPDFSGMTVGKFFKVLLDAMSQMFYSMSIAMGIMITYGSYTKDDTNLVKSVNQIEIFDTAIALLAGMIMIPVVYAFQGTKGLEASGPSLLFVSLPKVFEAMGFIGHFVGAAFFVLVVFAAITSSISIMEAINSVMMDKFGWSRKKSCFVILGISAAIALVTCLGYNILYFEVTLPNGKAEQQLLDVFDYLTNNMLMPIVAFVTCILIGWVAKPKYVVGEVKKNGEKFGREMLYNVMIKFVAPVFLILIFLSAFGVFKKL